MTSAGTNQAPHVPVLVDQVIAALALHEGDSAVDGTFGAGGYTRAMLGAGAGRVIAFDRDPDAIEDGKSLVPDPRLTLVNERFSQMDRVLAERGIGLIDAIALDIGMSSMQLDRADRGFSFQADGPLDMRMEKSGLTAAEFLNQADEAEIARVLRAYGEEPRARAIARAIVAARPVERTVELAAIVRRAAGFRPGQKADPATRTFQAIRIHLNAELDELEQGLEAAERALKPGGRLAVSAFNAYFALRHLEAGDTFDAFSGVNHERATLRDAGGNEREFDLWTTCFTPRELILLARAAGLEVDAVYGVTPGRYAAEPPSIDLPEHLLVAHRN